MDIKIIGEIGLPEKVEPKKEKKKSPDLVIVEMERGRDNSIIGRTPNGKVCILHWSSGVKLAPAEKWECIVTKDLEKFCIILPKSRLCSSEEAFKTNTEPLKANGIKTVSRLDNRGRLKYK